MKFVEKSFSHINLDLKNYKKENSNWWKERQNGEILESKPRYVSTYNDLVSDVAQILYRNRNLVLFYRGQDREHLDTERKATVLPSIYRDKKDEKRLLLKKRFKLLNHKTEKLRLNFRDYKIKMAGTRSLNQYPEIAWAILQHYGACDTPLLDLTHSLHVACSFAMDDNNNNTGIVYVFGMPWQTDAMGYNSFQEMVNIRLLSIAPPMAKRPYFQEGYLAAPFPLHEIDNPSRRNQFDFARRLIAKFEIPVKDEHF